MYSSSVSANREALWVGTRHRGHGDGLLACTQQTTRTQRQRSGQRLEEEEKNNVWCLKCCREKSHTDALMRAAVQLSARILHILCYRCGRWSVCCTSGSDDLTQRGSDSGEERNWAQEDHTDQYGGAGGGVHFYGFISTKKEQERKKKTSLPSIRMCRISHWSPSGAAASRLFFLKGCISFCPKQNDMYYIRL